MLIPSFSNAHYFCNVFPKILWPFTLHLNILTLIYYCKYAESHNLKSRNKITRHFIIIFKCIYTGKYMHRQCKSAWNLHLSTSLIYFYWLSRALNTVINIVKKSTFCNYLSLILKIPCISFHMSKTQYQFSAIFAHGGFLIRIKFLICKNRFICINFSIFHQIFLSEFAVYLPEDTEGRHFVKHNVLQRPRFSLKHPI